MKDITRKSLSKIFDTKTFRSIDVAAFYCPYIPLTSTGVIIDSETIQPITEFKTRYGTLNNLMRVYKDPNENAPILLGKGKNSEGEQ